MSAYLHKLKCFLCLVLAVIGAGTARASATITGINEVRELSVEKADQALPVKVEGQILWLHQGSGGFFLYQDGVGIYASKKNRTMDLGPFAVGERVRVEGITSRGHFSPEIVINHVTSLGIQPLPEAEPFHLHHLYSTSRDCDWVQIVGRIESMQILRDKQGGGRVELGVAHYGHLLRVQIPLTGGAEEKVKKLMFRRVRFNAVTGTLYNMTRQMLGRNFFVSSADAFEVVDDFVPSEGVKVEPIHSLLSTEDNPRHLIGTAGLVTHVEGQQIFLRGEKACLQVSVREKPDLRVGDFVEVEGFAVLRPVGPGFLATEIRVVEHHAPPQPVPFSLNEELLVHWEAWPDTRFSHELVQVDAQLIELSETFGLSTGQGERTLLCRQGAYLFETKLSLNMTLNEEVRPGAMLRLTGICNLARSTERNDKLYVDGFWLQARSADDIGVLVPAPWWTPRMLLGLLGIMLAMVGLVLVWVAALRRTVGKQTGVIAETVKRESVLNERQRIARELHDSLAQGLAGIALQMKGCRKRVESGADQSNLNSALAVMQQTLEHCSAESRNLIFDLRGGLLERMDLPAALDETLQPLADECGVALSITVAGPARRLNMRIERNLLLIAREAVTNAVRHASPKKILVELNYEAEGLSLSIRDDGCGFDTGQSPPLGHFGLRGMRERVNKLGGIFTIQSEPGSGTTIIVTLSGSGESEER